VASQSQAIGVAAGINWVVKDGLGCVGSVLAAGRFGKHVDEDPKRYKWMADVTNSLGVALELSSPMFPGMFLLVGSVGNSLKSVAAVLGGSARVSITRKFVRSGNLGDIQAKLHSQSITAYLLGMSIGVPLTIFCGDNMMRAAAVYAVLTGIQLFSSKRALTSVSFHYLNQQRSFLLIDSYLKSLRDGVGGVVQNPDQIGRVEQFITRFRRSRYGVVFGSSFSQLGADGLRFAKGIRGYFVQKQYFIVKETGGLHVMLRKDAREADKLEALFVALHAKHFVPSRSPLESWTSGFDQATHEYVLAPSIPFLATLVLPLPFAVPAVHTLTGAVADIPSS